MHTITIQGVDVPTLGLGTWQLEGDDCERGVAHALDVGYRHIDTAQGYGNEDRVGEGIAASGVDRDQIFLTTKLDTSNLGPDRVRSSFEDSLRQLRTDYVDLLLIHWPSDDVDPATTLGAMTSLRDEGKLRHVGVSNYPPSWLERAEEATRIFCNQVEYHPYLSQDELHRLAVERDFLLTAYSPLARGRALDDDTLTEIGEEHGANAAQVALRWLIQQDHVAAIPKATSPEHIESNLRALELELSDDEMKRIFALAGDERIIDPGSALDWER
jgi:2,5-diketo-D-gluconate reductase B